MDITLNGEHKSLPDKMTVAQLLESIHINSKEVKIAIEINNSICPKSDYGQTLLQPEDKIEIITAVGGG